MRAILKNSGIKSRWAARPRRGVADLPGRRDGGPGEIISAEEARRKEELKKLMDIYLKPPSYERSLGEYDKYLTELETSDSFKGQFFAKDLREDRRRFAKGERQTVNFLLWFGGVFGVIGLMFALRLFQKRFSSKLGTRKREYFWTRLEIARLITASRLDDDQSAMRAVRVLIRSPESFFNMRGFRRAVSELANLFLRQPRFIEYLAKLPDKEKAIDGICRALARPPNNPDVLTISCLTHLLAFLEKSDGRISPEACSQLASLLEKSDPADLNSAFLHLAVLRLLTRSSEQLGDKFATSVSARASRLSQLAATPDQVFLENLRFQMPGFAAFALSRGRTAIAHAKQLSSSLPQPGAPTVN